MSQKKAPLMPLEEKATGGAWRQSLTTYRGNHPLPPALDTEESRFARRMESLAEIFEFLSKEAQVSEKNRTLAKVLRPSFDAMAARVRMDAVAAPAPKRPEYFRSGADWIGNEFAPRLEGIIREELSQKKVAGIDARCAHVILHAGIPLVLDEALALKREFGMAREKGGVAALATAFTAIDGLKKIEKIAFYSGKIFTGAALAKRRRLVDALCAGTQPFDETVDAFAQRECVKRETAKKYLKEIAYAAHETGLARIPKTYRAGVEALRHAVDSKQSGISNASLSRAGEKIVAFPKDGDRQKLLETYAPLDAGEIGAQADEILSLLAKAARAKGRAMGENAPRTWSFFQGLLGTITHFEGEKLALVAPEECDSVKHWHLDYGLHRARAICCYEEAIAQVKELVDQYRTGKNPDAAALIANLALPEEEYGELPVDAQEGLDKYVERLRVRVDRWMDHPSKRGLLPIPIAMKNRLNAPGLAPELARLSGNIKKGDHFYSLAKRIRAEYLAEYLDA